MTLSVIFTLPKPNIVILREVKVAPVKRFFESADNECEEAVSFFVRQVCFTRNLPPMFFAGYGILFAENFLRIDPHICTDIMRKVRLFADPKTLSDFVSIVCNANDGKYICIDENVYSYADWLRFSCDGKKISATENVQLTKIYTDIVNPSTQLQKKLISADYRFVQRIYPLSEEIALYALNVNLDAYNYLPFASPSVIAHYDKMKAEQVNLSNIGTLSASPGEGVTVSVMNSQKPFHLQLKQFISQIKIRKIIIACGYCFSSGLSLLNDIIQRELAAGVPCELYVGSLQNYDESAADNLITGIDKATIRLLNQYLSCPNFSLYTCSDRFYHGKIYLFEGENFSAVIIGSSNVSRAAFVSNYELNLAFHIPAGGTLLEHFILWTNQLRYRLNLWMSYEPDVIAEDLGIVSLPNYFVFAIGRVI